MNCEFSLPGIESFIINIKQETINKSDYLSDLYKIYIESCSNGDICINLNLQNITKYNIENYFKLVESDFKIEISYSKYITIICKEYTDIKYEISDYQLHIPHITYNDIYAVIILNDIFMFEDVDNMMKDFIPRYHKDFMQLLFDFDVFMKEPHCISLSIIKHKPSDGLRAVDLSELRKLLEKQGFGLSLFRVLPKYNISNSLNLIDKFESYDSYELSTDDIFPYDWEQVMKDKIGDINIYEFCNIVGGIEDIIAGIECPNIILGLKCFDNVHLTLFNILKLFLSEPNYTFDIFDNHTIRINTNNAHFYIDTHNNHKKICYNGSKLTSEYTMAKHYVSYNMGSIHFCKNKNPLISPCYTYFNDSECIQRYIIMQDTYTCSMLEFLSGLYLELAVAHIFAGSKISIDGLKSFIIFINAVLMTKYKNIKTYKLINNTKKTNLSITVEMDITANTFSCDKSIPDISSEYYVYRRD
jgi:hypothetical protein